MWMCSFSILTVCVLNWLQTQNHSFMLLSVLACGCAVVCAKIFFSSFSYPLQDKDFGKQTLYKAHNNPPAEVSSTLKHYQTHSLKSAYEGRDFFWAITPLQGDYILFNFSQPVYTSGLVCLVIFHTFCKFCKWMFSILKKKKKRRGQKHKWWWPSLHIKLLYKLLSFIHTHETSSS